MKAALFILVAAIFLALAVIFGLIALFLVYAHRRKTSIDRIANDVVKQYFVGKRDGLTIDEIEERLASQNGIEVLEPFSRHLERVSALLSSLPASEILVLQRIAFDICCARGLYSAPTGKMLTPLEHENLKHVGNVVVLKFEHWQSAGA